MKIFTFFPLFHRILYTGHICHIVYYECRCDHLFLGNYQGILVVDIDNVYKKNKLADFSQKIRWNMFDIAWNLSVYCFSINRGKLEFDWYRKLAKWKQTGSQISSHSLPLTNQKLVLLKVSKKRQAWNLASRLVPQILLQMSFHSIVSKKSCIKNCLNIYLLIFFPMWYPNSFLIIFYSEHHIPLNWKTSMFWIFGYNTFALPIPFVSATIRMLLTNISMITTGSTADTMPEMIKLWLNYSKAYKHCV
jgi:hypothetical protein